MHVPKESEIKSSDTVFSREIPEIGEVSSFWEDYD